MGQYIDLQQSTSQFNIISQNIQILTQIKSKYQHRYLNKFKTVNYGQKPSLQQNLGNDLLLMYPETTKGYVIRRRERKEDVVVGMGFLVGENVVVMGGGKLGGDVKQLFFQGGGNIGKPVLYQIEKIFIENLQMPVSKQPCSYTILTLKQNIGNIYGYLGLNFQHQKTSNLLLINQKTTAPSSAITILPVFSQLTDIKIYEQFLCYQTKNNNNKIGSPILYMRKQKYCVVGIHMGYREEFDSQCGLYFTEEIKGVMNGWLSSKKGCLNLSKQCLNDHVMKCIRNEKFLDLVQLNLDENQLTATGAYHLTRSPWKILEILTLANNQIQDEGVLYLAQNRWPQLRELNLRANSITDIGMLNLQQNRWQNLQKRYLSDNRISDAGFLILREIRWQKLSLLSLSGNLITDWGICSRDFDNWQGLSWLYLANNQISDKGVEYLVSQRWPSLQQLSLINNIEISEKMKAAMTKKFQKNQKNNLQIKL